MSEARRFRPLTRAADVMASPRPAMLLLLHIASAAANMCCAPPPDTQVCLSIDYNVSYGTNAFFGPVVVTKTAADCCQRCANNQPRCAAWDWDELHQCCARHKNHSAAPSFFYFAHRRTLCLHVFTVLKTDGEGSTISPTKASGRYAIPIAPKRPPSGGLGAGSTTLLVLSLLLVAYIGAGLAYNVGMHGDLALPPLYPSALPGLVHDGMMFTMGAGSVIVARLRGRNRPGADPGAMQSRYQNMGGAEEGL